MQGAGTSRAGGGSHSPQVNTNSANSRQCSAPGRPARTAVSTTRAPSIITVKDGDPTPEGYVLVVETPHDLEAPARHQQRIPCESLDLSTPPKAPQEVLEEGPDTGKSKKSATKNTTRNANRKANVAFARDLKESLATGEPVTLKVAEEEGACKAAWHAAAKEVAYKFLDLTKESWKDYSIFERTVVHNELNEQYKFDPPLKPSRIDKYLSCHLRTSRAVWKAHWKKYGPSERHHNCPQLAWDMLCKRWPTAKSQEEAAKMSSRRARVEKGSKVGRSSLLDRMDETVSKSLALEEQVSNNHIQSRGFPPLGTLFMHFLC